jgi:hypothetical protein
MFTTMNDTERQVKAMFPNVSPDVLARSFPDTQIAKSDIVKPTTPPMSQAARQKATGKRMVIVVMDYPGSIISENHYLGRNGKHTYVKDEARIWQTELIFKIKRYEIDWQLPLKVTVEAVFKNRRESCDLHNFKCLYDAIQLATGLDDKNFHTATSPGIIDKSQRPHILITIEEL